MSNSTDQAAPQGAAPTAASGQGGAVGRAGGSPAYRKQIPPDQGSLLLEMCKTARRLAARRASGGLRATPEELEWFADVAASPVLTGVIETGEEMSRLGPRVAIDFDAAMQQSDQSEVLGIVTDALAGTLLYEAILEKYGAELAGSDFLAGMDAKRLVVSLLINGQEFSLPEAVAAWEAKVDALVASRAEVLFREKLQVLSDIIDEITSVARKRLAVVAD